MTERQELVSIRMSTAELARLDALARATERDRSKVVRWLIALARDAELVTRGDLALPEAEGVNHEQ